MPAFTFRTNTVITWGSYEDQNENLDFDIEREAKLQNMAMENKTDGSAIIVSPTITKRFFVDTAAAQEYIDFIMAVAVGKYNLSVISTEIQENDI